MRFQGEISEWNDERGFGFVLPRESADRVFVHISEFPPGSRRPSPGEMVNFKLTRDDRGRPRATSVTYIVGRPPVRGRQHSSRGPLVATVTTATFLAVLVMAVVVGRLPWPVVAIYVVASIVTYVAYANDKRAAQTGRWRATEGGLLLLGLAGGWPGGLIAQHQLRHKTKKGSFQAAYWLTVGLNCAGLLLLRPA